MEPDLSAGARPAARADKKDALARRLSRTARVLLLTALTALLTRAFVAEQFYVSGRSMLGTLHEPDRVLVEKVTGRFGAFSRGDILVFTMTTSEGPRELVKRVVGLPGERIEFRGCRVLVDDAVLDEPYISQENLTDCGRDSYGPVTLRSGQLFVLGDNRGDSSDSRFFGPIAEEQVVGRAVVVFWPPTHWRSL